MGHGTKRTLKNCLNCNAEVHEAFCGICGQENIEPQETASHLVSHFFQDITHFDGKFFSSLKFLFFRPGFLSAEYGDGRRTSYLNPVRMYVFTSAIFFLIFFTVFSGDELTGSVNGKQNDSKKKTTGIFLSDSKYRDRAQYDSLLQTGTIEESMITRFLQRKEFVLQEKYGGDSSKVNREFINIFLHLLPQMFFLSLPLFALFLKWLYYRHKNLFYVSHAIFTIHIYCFWFLIYMLSMLFDRLSYLPYMSWLSWLEGLCFFLMFFYLYKAMRYFYGQRRGKTILKYALLMLWLILVLIILLGVMVILSIYKL